MTKANTEEILRCVRAGMTSAQVADFLGCSVRTVQRCAAVAGLMVTGRHPATTMGDHLIAGMARALGSNAAAARELGVSPATVARRVAAYHRPPVVVREFSGRDHGNTAGRINRVSLPAIPGGW